MVSPAVVLAESIVREYLKNHDASHDYAHVHRVRKNAECIHKMESTNNPSTIISQEIIVLAAIFHDVGDFKYTKK